MKVSVLMTQPVLRIDEDSTIQKAMEIMSKERVGALLVMREGKDVGIVTEKDIISKIVARKDDWEEAGVKDFMSIPIVTVDKDMDIEDAVKIMVEHGVRRVLVTDKREIVGIFSTGDVTKLVQLVQTS
jgi:CBS domain-containing protein